MADRAPLIQNPNPSLLPVLPFPLPIPSGVLGDGGGAEATVHCGGRRGSEGRGREGELVVPLHTAGAVEHAPTHGMQGLPRLQAVKVASFIKDHVQVVDHESHLLKYVVIEGGLIGQRLKSQKFEVKLEASGNGGCMVKTKVEYDTLDDKPLSEEELAEMKGGLVQSLKAMEGYLLANASAYV